MDVIRELTELRDSIRATVAMFEHLDLEPNQERVLEGRRALIEKIEADIIRLRG